MRTNYTFTKTFETKLNVNDALKMELKVANICREMAENGFPLDQEEAERQVQGLQERVDWVDEAVLPFIPPKPKIKGTEVHKLFKMNGEYTKQVLDWYPDADNVEGPFCRVEWHPINLGSSKQVNEFLLSRGWQPTEWNYKKDKRGKDIKDAQGNLIKTSPKITEDSLEDLEGLGVAGRLIAYRRKVTHKRNQIQGFLRNMREDGCVPSEVNTLGAETRRMTHRKIANVPTPRRGQFWPHMRKIFVAGHPDWVVVGCDASQIQIRGLGHYAAAALGDHQLIEDLVAGDKGLAPDIHTLNGERVGVSRNDSKGIFYGYLFGAGIPKTASQLGVSRQKAARLRKRFDESVPFVTKLIDHLISFYRKYGFITGLDGTRIYSSSEHMLLVYLLQNFEAVFMKTALCYAHDRIKRQGLRAKLVTMQHDELQYISHKDDAEDLARLLEKAMVDAGEYVGSLCPVVGEAKIGNSWLETH